MLGWGHSKKRLRVSETNEPDSLGTDDLQKGSAAVQRLLIILKDGSPADEIPAGH